MRILALTRYGPLAASTRQRFLQFGPALAEAGMELHVSPLLLDEHMRRLVAGRPISFVEVAKGYSRRLVRLLTGRRFDLLWLHCESFPYLPAALDRLIFLAGRPVVYDFDDAMFHMYDESPRPIVRRLLGGKLDGLMKGAAACTCGNPYLQAYASRFNPNALIVPTVVDTDRYRPASSPPADPPVIGWIGSPSTWANVRPLLGLLAGLHRETGVRIRAVGAGAAAEADRFDGLELVEWSEETEVAEVQGFTIGIMPLIDRPFERGKSGFKLIQYMACGLPSVASPVGVNAEIVTPETGFVAADEEQWREALLALIRDPALRARMGAAGRVRAVDSFSLASQAPRLVELFRSLAATPR